MLNGVLVSIATGMLGARAPTAWPKVTYHSGQVKNPSKLRDSSWTYTEHLNRDDHQQHVSRAAPSSRRALTQVLWEVLEHGVSWIEN